MPPGIVMVWSGDRPVMQVFDVPLHDKLTLAREMSPHDDRISTQHATVYGGDGEFVITDLGSRNGTYVNGDEVTNQKVVCDHAVVRTGRTVWVAFLDIAPIRTSTYATQDAVPFDELATILVDVARSREPDLRIHASAIETCLLSAWGDRAEFVAAVQAAVARCRAAGKERLRAGHFEKLKPRYPPLPFAQVFEKWMGGPPPFAIPDDYEVITKQDIDGYPYEVMIGTPGSGAIVTQADVGAVEQMQIGWFMAGFWGHGLNSYSVYYGRITEKYRVFLRLPYGEGVYESEPEKARARALALIAQTQRLVDTLDVRHIRLVQSMGQGSYRLVRRDGSVAESPQEDFYSWDDVDFAALVRGS